MIVKRQVSVGLETVSVERIDPICYDELRQELQALHSSAEGVAALIYEATKLLQRDPALQLALNLGTVAKLMANSHVFTVIPDGLTDAERKMLDTAARVLGQKAQLGLHGVLNLHERQLFIEYFGMVFNAHKCKHTGDEHGQEDREEQSREEPRREVRLQVGGPGGPDRAGVPQDA